jgi:hypothetical protein
VGGSGRQRATAGGSNNIKTLLAQRRTAPRNLIIFLPPDTTRVPLCSVHPLLLTFIHIFQENFSIFLVATE